MEWWKCDAERLGECLNMAVGYGVIDAIDNSLFFCTNAAPEVVGDVIA